MSAKEETQEKDEKEENQEVASYFESLFGFGVSKRPMANMGVKMLSMLLSIVAFVTCGTEQSM